MLFNEGEREQRAIQQSSLTAVEEATLWLLVEIERLLASSTTMNVKWSHDKKEILKYR